MQNAVEQDVMSSLCSVVITIELLFFLNLQLNGLGSFSVKRISVRATEVSVLNLKVLHMHFFKGPANTSLVSSMLKK